MPSHDANSVARFTNRIQSGREIDGCSAILLPFVDGQVDWDGFLGHLLRTHRQGLTPAVNMDTGFGPQLSPVERLEVLRQTREALPEHAGFIAGAGVFGVEGDVLQGYQRSVGEIVELGGTPIVFQSEWLSSRQDQELADAYRAIVGEAPRALAFELGTMFAPFGRIYSLGEYERLLEIEPLVGAKHSSLDRVQELDRLELRDRVRPGFKVYTGNDLAIDMVMVGSDYLLGLSTFDPDAFAQRDAWWRESDARFFGLNDALQALGAVAFRDPVPAYKDSARVYLQLTGHLSESADVHPACPRRPGWEYELLRPLMERIEACKRA